MSIAHHSFKVQRNAHFSTFGSLHKKTKCIWIGFHGYGQLARRMIEKFNFLDPEDHFVICPEGLNRFYWNNSGKPVACWMTKEDRYDEIDDFVQFLDSLYGRYCGHVDQQVPIVLLGFSQGCATMWRWIHKSKPRINAMINWAGWIPEDISYHHLKEYLDEVEIRLIYGDEDQYIDAKALEGIQTVISGNQLTVNISQFHGEHRIPQEELKKLVTDLGY